jgi:hypothetical protein
MATYLTRTNSSSSNTYTFSAWLKHTTVGVNDYKTICLFGTDRDVSTTMSFAINNSDKWNVYNGSSHTSSDQVARDCNAWYHVVLKVDNLVGTIYVNNEIAKSSITCKATGTETNKMIVGGYVQSGNEDYFNGVMAHVHFIDGTAYDASAFGETDATTGIWKPKTAPSVTYGTNGFFLKFENSGAFGTDSSGNANNFTVNGTMTQNIDTPSNVFATLNALNNLSTSGSGTLTKGNLEVSYSGGLFNTNATISVSTGKWYWETKGVSNMQQGSVGARIGFLNQDNTGYANQFFDGGCIFGMYWHPTNGIYTSVGATQTLRSSTLTYTDGDIIGIALDLTNNISYWYKNGSLSFTYDFSALSTIGSSYICPALGNGSGTSNPVFQANFGNGYFGTTAVSSAQNPDDGIGIFEYDVPTGYYALNTKAINAQEYD